MIQCYQFQLHRQPEAVDYLAQRGVRQPEAVEQMRIGYAPGRCLRAWRMRLGYSLCDLQQVGVVSARGFDAHVACCLGSGAPMHQLCDGASRTVLLAFDSDANGSGQRAARQPAQRLRAHDVDAFPVELPTGHDPNSFFVHGGGNAHHANPANAKWLGSISSWIRARCAVWPGTRCAVMPSR